MRYFLIIWLASFFPAYSQDSLVTIKPETARYFLRADDRAKILEEKDSLSSKLISTQQTELVLKDSIIKTYKRDSVSYKKEIVTLNDQITLKDKETRRKLRLKNLLIILEGVVIVLMII